MQQAIEVPTPRALADLVARCVQINRYATELAAAEETRIAALGSALLSMRHILRLPDIDEEKLPLRQRRNSHWALTAPHLSDALTPAIRAFHGVLVLDEHEQVKILSDRSWRGGWQTVTLWRDGVQGLSAAALMDYLAHLAALAQQWAPDVGRSLLERSEAVVSAGALLPEGPRSRND